MGRRGQAAEASDYRGVSSSEGVLDQQEKEPEAQGRLMQALIGTVHHFFGGFSPSFRQSP